MHGKAQEVLSEEIKLQYGMIVEKLQNYKKILFTDQFDNDTMI